MMNKTDPEEIETWLASLFLKGTMPQGSNWWDMDKIDIPFLLIEKETTRESNITTIRHYLKVRFNKHGREKRLYQEWPKAILASNWSAAAFDRVGLLLERQGLEVLTLKSGNDTGKATYRRRDPGSAIWTLEAYEGTVK